MAIFSTLTQDRLPTCIMYETINLYKLPVNLNKVTSTPSVFLRGNSLVTMCTIKIFRQTSKTLKKEDIVLIIIDH